MRHFKLEPVWKIDATFQSSSDLCRYMLKIHLLTYSTCVLLTHKSHWDRVLLAIWTKLGIFKENWIQGVGNRVSVHFAVTYLDCWRTSFCVTTIIKIVNNNTNDKQTFGGSLALDEDSPYTNSCLFTIDRLPLLLFLRKN